MKRFRSVVSLSVLVLLVAASSAFAQGTTGSLTGTTMHEGAPLPGVRVTISSPSMQGKRTAETNINGDYFFQAIPPGDYTVVFEMEGMRTTTQELRVGLAQTARADARIQLSAVAEAITVTASAPAALENTEVQTNFQAELISDLPVGRTLLATTLLAPGTNANGPSGNVTISGSYSYDNLYLINGAVVNENLRGQPSNLFIEDAIEETTILTGAISAEYGRFTGGVVSAISKSGGNEFTGSFRDSFTNPSWTEKTPFPDQPDPADELNEVYEATLGGRIIRDRLWFFLAGRQFESSVENFLKDTSTPFLRGTEDERWEAKLTGQITPLHSLAGSYLEYNLTNTNICFGQCYELSAVDRDGNAREHDFTTLHYNGILSPSFFIEASWAQKNHLFTGDGDTVTREFAGGTYGLDYVDGGYFGAPVFCGFCSPEDRNNETYGLRATYYLATRALGTHSLVAGYENWAETRLSNNFQSNSNFSFWVFNSPERAASGTVLPVISLGDWIIDWPITALSEGTDWVTDSLYLNDKWELNDRWSFNLGVRYDKNDGRDSEGKLIADDDKFSPRLGAIFDLFGDGRFRINASYSQYVSRIVDSIGDSSSPAGQPGYTIYEYRGPDISGLPTVQAFQQAYDWFLSQGGLGARDLIVYQGVPGVNVLFRDRLTSPSVEEINVGFGMQLGRNAYARVDYITREWGDFYTRRADTTTGSVEDALGNEFDLFLVENSDNLERSYDAIQLQSDWRIGTRFQLGGSYTWSELTGNTTGETSGSGPVTDAPDSYPEYTGFPQYNPTGFVSSDQTHKVRLYGSYELPTPIGQFTFGLLQRFDSGTPYSAVGDIDLRRSANFYGTGQAGGVLNPGFINPPSATNYYFSERGEFRWDDLTATDLALGYELPIWRAELFARADLINAFNDDAQISGSTAVFTHRTADQGLRRFNPHAGDVPVEGEHYRLSPNFGKATNVNHYQMPRTYRVGFGVRF